MKWVLSFGVCCLLVTAPYQTSAGKKAGTVIKTIEKKVAQKEITMLVSMPAKSVVGSAVDLKITFHNGSKADLPFFTRVVRYDDYELQLLDAKGKGVPLTKFGKQVEHSLKFGGSSKRLTLAAGKDIEVTLNLARVFDLSMEGEYTLTINRELDGISLRVEGMEFQMLDDADR